METVLAPSLLSADILNLERDVRRLIEAGAKRLHLDVMDQHFVNNFTFGPLVCKALCDKGLEVLVDVHLMVDPVRPLLESSIEAGAHSVLWHQKTSRDLKKDIEWVKSQGCKVGLALNPDEAFESIQPYLDFCDYLLLMTVYPGFGGQAFLPGSLERIETIAKALPASCQLMVDGGVHRGNVLDVKEAGAAIIVSGSGIFSHAKGCAKGFEAMQAIINP